MEKPLLLTLEEAAQLLGIGVGSVQGLVDRGEIRVVRIGSDIRLTRQAIDSWIEESSCLLTPDLASSTSRSNPVEEISQVPDFDRQRVTVAQYLDYWLRMIQATIRPKTYSSYSTIVRNYLIPQLGKHRLAQLKPIHVQKMMGGMSETHSTQTTRHARAVLRGALNQAMRWEYVDRNVAMLVTPPKLRKSKLHVFTPEQAKTFLVGIINHPNETLYRTALTLGLRQGELLGLRWQDIDFERRELSVRVALQRQKGKGLILVPPKTTSNQPLPIPDLLLERLRALRAKQPENQELVFTTHRGKPIDAPKLCAEFKTLLRTAGLPIMRFHDLRHSCATFLVSQGVHMRVVMDILRHSQINLTMNTYAHTLSKDLRDGVDKVDGLLE